MLYSLVTWINILKHPLSFVLSTMYYSLIFLHLYAREIYPGFLAAFALRIRLVVAAAVFSLLHKTLRQPKCMFDWYLVYTP